MYRSNSASVDVGLFFGFPSPLKVVPYVAVA